MAYTIVKPYTLYKLEQVQKEIGIFDLMDWSNLIADYNLNPEMIEIDGFIGMEKSEKDRLVHELKEKLATMP